MANQEQLAAPLPQVAEKNTPPTKDVPEEYLSYYEYMIRLYVRRCQTRRTLATARCRRSDTRSGVQMTDENNDQRQPGKPTDDDLDRAAGKFDVLAGLLQEKYGYSHERAAKEIARRVT